MNEKEISTLKSMIANLIKMEEALSEIIDNWEQSHVEIEEFMEENGWCPENACDSLYDAKNSLLDSYDYIERALSMDAQKLNEDVSKFEKKTVADIVNEHI